jgi:hypothetical protein
MTTTLGFSAAESEKERARRQSRKRRMPHERGKCVGISRVSASEPDLGGG